jgi:hypothetical protein
MSATLVDAAESVRRQCLARGAQGTDTLPGVRAWCLSLLRTGTGAGKKGACPQQYVEALSGEPVCRSGVSAVAVETFINNVG